MVDTHYFYRPETLDGDSFGRFVDDVKRLISAAPGDPVRGEDGVGRPEASEQRVAFNGDAAHGLEHEPFVIERIFRRGRTRGAACFDFCKTNGKPYDLLVVASLYAFLHRFPGVKFVSDSTLEELRPGFDYFTRIVAPGARAQTLFARPLQDREVAV
jgi:hypothetical protein